MADPIPFYAAPIPTGGEMPPGAIPVRVYGLDASGGVPPIESEDLMGLFAYDGETGWISVSGPMRDFLGDMGYGTPGQVLATNSAGNSLEWVTPNENAPTEPQ